MNNSSYHVLVMYEVATISRLLKSQGLFSKEPYKRDDILQKRPIVLSSLLIVATPYEKVKSHVNGSCFIWASRVTFDCDMAHVNESRYTCKWAMFHANESCLAWMSHVICELDMWISHSCMTKPCPIWMSHVMQVWERGSRSTRRIKKWVVYIRQEVPKNHSFHTWINHVMYEWVKSQWNESCHIRMSYVTFECVMSHVNESYFM